MSLYIGSVVVNVSDLNRAIDFWTAALGYKVRSKDKSFAVLTDPSRRWSNISMQLSDEPKRGRNRVHLDLYSSDQDGEVERLEGLGARRVPWEYEEGDDYVVMTDPDGNEFCVIDSDVPQDEWG